MDMCFLLAQSINDHEYTGRQTRDESKAVNVGVVSDQQLTAEAAAPCIFPLRGRFFKSAAVSDGFRSKWDAQNATNIFSNLRRQQTPRKPLSCGIAARDWTLIQ